MARPHEANSDSEMESEQAEAPTIVKKRKEVTTASILENFLLLATSLDDTVREDAVVRAMGVPDSSSSKTSGKSSSKADSKTCVINCLAALWRSKYRLADFTARTLQPCTSSATCESTEYTTARSARKYTRSYYNICTGI